MGRAPLTLEQKAAQAAQWRERYATDPIFAAKHRARLANLTPEQLMVETISILPRTLVISEEKMKVGDVNSQMYVVYGHDPATRKVWCATFIDEQEAEAWVHGSKTFGRPVLGAVMAGQENKISTERAEVVAEASDGAIAAPEPTSETPS